MRVTETTGNSFRLPDALVGIALLVFVPIVGVGAAIVLPVLRAPENSPGLSMILLPLMVLALAALIPFAMAKSLATNFVAPLILKFEIGSREAWKRFWAIGKLHIGSIVVFWLVGFGFAIVAALAGVSAGLVTCCLGFPPILHQTIMAPYYVFERAWTLEILASMSPDFDMRAVPIEPYDGGSPPPFGYGQHGYCPPGSEWRGDSAVLRPRQPVGLVDRVLQAEAARHCA